MKLVYLLVREDAWVYFDVVPTNFNFVGRVDLSKSKCLGFFGNLVDVRYGCSRQRMLKLVSEIRIEQVHTITSRR